MNAADLSLRPVQAFDEAFLRRVYADARAPEIALTGWEAASANAFLRMQFDAQFQHYRRQYPQARFDVVERAGIAVGRLTVAREADAIRIVDIALLASCRRQGIGTALLRRLLEEAGRDGRRVTLQVEQHNRARALYQRLGFTAGELHGLYLPLEWRPLRPDHPA
jgi:ribosomal protein S18 acetylase RimI-like enzyme